MFQWRQCDSSGPNLSPFNSALMCTLCFTHSFGCDERRKKRKKAANQHTYIHTNRKATSPTLWKHNNIWNQIVCIANEKKKNEKENETKKATSFYFLFCCLLSWIWTWIAVVFISISLLLHGYTVYGVPMHSAAPYNLYVYVCSAMCFHGFCVHFFIFWIHSF